jgi:hypothetical protein
MVQLCLVLSVDTNFLEFPLIFVDFRRDQHEYSDMVVKVVETAHTGDTVMPSPSDLYCDFLDRKNGLTWNQINSSGNLYTLQHRQSIYYGKM